MERTSRTAIALAGAAVMVAVAGSASANGTLAPPETSGTLVVQNRIDEVPLSTIARATRDGADVTMAYQELSAGPKPWHTHPGPVIVTIIEGSLEFQSAQGDACETVSYVAGQGFVDQGMGNVHRVIVGEEGVKFYATFLAPAGAGPVTSPAEAPAACA